MPHRTGVDLSAGDLAPFLPRGQLLAYPPLGPEPDLERRVDRFLRRAKV